MAYNLDGALLEVCTCNILCPCWVGEDPDNGDCQSIMAWNFTSRLLKKGSKCRI